MPKNPHRNKRGKVPVRSRTSLISRPAHSVNRQVNSVKQFLTSGATKLRYVTEQLARQNFWNEWMSRHVPAEIRAKISGVAAQDGTLTIFAETAAWSARLRFLILELEPEMRAADPRLGAVRVRVLPRG